MSEEGYIKFELRHRRGPAPGPTVVTDLLDWRQRLYDRQLIGCYPGGIGYGNLSRRSGLTGAFWISGTRTGCLKKLSPDHFTRVTRFDPSANRVDCRGPIAASSESMSHGMIYRSLEWANAVIHVHHAGLWEQLLQKLPAIPAAVPYGSPEMAFAIQQLLSRKETLEAGLFAMAGHEEGVISFGESLVEAGEKIFEYMSDEYMST